MTKQLLGLFALLIYFALPSTYAQSGEPIPAALVLIVDSSDSVTTERWDVQMHGYAYAFRNPAVVQAIRDLGPEGAMVSLVAFAGPAEQKVLIQWHRLTTTESVLAFADQFLSISRPYSGGSTSINNALVYGVNLLNQLPYDAERRIIDISGDGQTRDSLMPAEPHSVPLSYAREQVIAHGITVNGLPILGDEAGIDIYYEQNVITPDGFIEVVRDPTDVIAFRDAIVRKVMRELLASATIE